MGAPTSWTPVVLYIDCENGATHSFNYTTGETVVGENFYRAQCSCPSGYQGDRCDVTPCSAQPNPCYNASMCHMYSNGSYYCDSCPDGMVGDDRCAKIRRMPGDSRHLSGAVHQLGPRLPVQLHHSRFGCRLATPVCAKTSTNAPPGTIGAEPIRTRRA
ncbi:hypothetical protein BOX15_Mlig009433g2 [Macrostomum lignano]|uniref:EGF-like domain-containing protein n=1 Tax=Macrostomum lignano TaxID=282301 RepID=A0A267G8C5_9PLAT|nr:hypothetical protein BOX15_Mlig009433g2 [Macrostomum lignano]